jgi:exodeoxyribonuclease-1
MSPSIFWYDFETTGVDAILDRPLQFAGVRTDLELNIIGEPVNVFSAPGNDVIPNPDAIAVTGLSMLELSGTGLSETDFCKEVLRHVSEPETCVAGYNSIRFDDEFLRQMCYRNFRDPYEREWRNGNSRWDVIDFLRMAFALRPDGINWPLDEGGLPMFRLELLTEANDIEHGQAHDAVSDVIATIELTKRVKEAQPKLYEFLFRQRQKKVLLQQLYPLGKQAVVHVSSMYGAKRSCLGIVLPICSHPTNSNGVICYDLTVDPVPLIDANAEEVARLVFSTTQDLAEGESRIPLKTVHVNRCPAIAPLATLGQARAERLGIDLSLCEERLRLLQKTAGLTEKINDAFANREFPSTEDPDRMLYQGGFFGSSDVAIMAQIHEAEVEDLPSFAERFKDDRLPEMLFRFRARNYPEGLSVDERERWLKFCRERWSDGVALTESLDRIEALHLEKGEVKGLGDLRQYLLNISADVLG